MVVVVVLPLIYSSFNEIEKYCITVMTIKCIITMHKNDLNKLKTKYNSLCLPYGVKCNLDMFS